MSEREREREIYPGWILDIKIQEVYARTLFVTYTYRICSEVKSGDAQHNVQQNAQKDNLNWIRIRTRTSTIFTYTVEKKQQE